MGWETYEIRTAGGLVIATNHVCDHEGTTEPVTSAVTGEVVAFLCTACDKQLDVRRGP